MRIRETALSRKIIDLADTGMKPSEIMKQLNVKPRVVYMSIQRHRLAVRDLYVGPLPEPYMAVFKRIAEHSGKSYSDCIRDLLIKAIDEHKEAA
jgi:hypothetical protein